MFSMNDDKDRLRFILIGIISTSLLSVVIILCIQLSHSTEVEEIEVEELLQQYWQEQESHQSIAYDEQVAANDAESKEISEDDSDKHETSIKEHIETNDHALENMENEALDYDGKIDINRATAEQLQQLKGIGPSKAKAIVEDRELKGSFRSIADIKRVKGIGEKLYEGIQESIVAIP